MKPCKKNYTSLKQYLARALTRVRADDSLKHGVSYEGYVKAEVLGDPGISVVATPSGKLKKESFFCFIPTFHFVPSFHREKSGFYRFTGFKIKPNNEGGL